MSERHPWDTRQPAIPIEQHPGAWPDDAGPDVRADPQWRQLLARWGPAYVTKRLNELRREAEEDAERRRG